MGSTVLAPQPRTSPGAKIDCATVGQLAPWYAVNVKSVSCPLLLTKPSLRVAGPVRGAFHTRQVLVPLNGCAEKGCKNRPDLERL